MFLELSKKVSQVVFFQGKRNSKGKVIPNTRSSLITSHYGTCCDSTFIYRVLQFYMVLNEKHKTSICFVSFHWIWLSTCCSGFQMESAHRKSAQTIFDIVIFLLLLDVPSWLFTCFIYLEACLRILCAANSALWKGCGVGSGSNQCAVEGWL